jgi:hypothetical protein
MRTRASEAEVGRTASTCKAAGEPASEAAPRPAKAALHGAKRPSGRSSPTASESSSSWGEAALREVAVLRSLVPMVTTGRVRVTTKKTTLFQTMATKAATRKAQKGRGVIAAEAAAAAEAEEAEATTPMTLPKPPPKTKTMAREHEHHHRDRRRRYRCLQGSDAANVVAPSSNTTTTTTTTPNSRVCRATVGAAFPVAEAPRPHRRHFASGCSIGSRRPLRLCLCPLRRPLYRRSSARGLRLTRRNDPRGSVATARSTTPVSPTRATSVRRVDPRVSG